MAASSVIRPKSLAIAGALGRHEDVTGAAEQDWHHRHHSVGQSGYRSHRVTTLSSVLSVTFFNEVDRHAVQTRSTELELRRAARLGRAERVHSVGLDAVDVPRRGTRRRSAVFGGQCATVDLRRPALLVEGIGDDAQLLGVADALGAALDHQVERLYRDADHAPRIGGDVARLTSP